MIYSGNDVNVESNVSLRTATIAVFKDDVADVYWEIYGVNDGKPAYND